MNRFAPKCPNCDDAAFVKQERVVTVDVVTEGAIWTCGSCLHSWPAPKPIAKSSGMKATINQNIIWGA
jgi:hypothetical protein